MGGTAAGSLQGQTRREKDNVVITRFLPRSTRPLAAAALSVGVAMAGVSALAEPPHNQEAPAETDADRRALAVATYEGGAVTVGEIEDTIANSSPLIQATALEPAALRGFLDRNLRFELQLKEAERRGYRQDERVRKAAKENAVQRMTDHDINKPMSENPPTPEQLRAYFQSHIEAFSLREKRRARVLIVASAADARALLPQVKAADDATLKELVRTRGLDVPSRAKGGDLGNFDAKGAPESGDVVVDPKLASAAFALPAAGAVSDVIELDDVAGKAGYAILKLGSIRPGHVPKFEDVKVRVGRRYDDERYEKAVRAIADSQRELLKPVVHEELLQQVKLQ
jgi:hypothetical protein